MEGLCHSFLPEDSQVQLEKIIQQARITNLKWVLNTAQESYCVGLISELSHSYCRPFQTSFMLKITPDPPLPLLLPLSPPNVAFSLHKENRSHGLIFPYPNVHIFVYIPSSFLLSHCKSWGTLFCFRQYLPCALELIHPLSQETGPITITPSLS